jgi:hypothetical protein
MAHEIDLGLQWLSATLKADTTLMGYAPGGVWRAMAPPGTPTPFIIIGFVNGDDLTTANGVRIFTHALYQVRASGPAADTEPVALAGGRLDETIGDKRNQAITDGLILSSDRDSPLQYDELVSGKQWTNYGGIYHLQIDQA